MDTGFPGPFGQVQRLHAYPERPYVGPADLAGIFCQLRGPLLMTLFPGPLQLPAWLDRPGGPKNTSSFLVSGAWRVPGCPRHQISKRTQRV